MPVVGGNGLCPTAGGGSVQTLDIPRDRSQHPRAPSSYDEVSTYDSQSNIERGLLPARGSR